MSKLEDLEQRIKALERYVAAQRWDKYYTDQQLPSDKLDKAVSDSILMQKCLWESVPVEDRGKPMGLSCPCSKCSAYSMTY